MDEKDRAYLFIDSSDRFLGSSDAFVFRVPNALINVATLRLESCVIPYTWYDITDASFLLFEEQAGGGQISTTLPSQHYSPSDLGNSVQAALNASSPNGWTYTVTYNPDTLKYTIASVSGNFSLLWTTAVQSPNEYNYMSYFLGFTGIDPRNIQDPDSPFLATHTSSSAAVIAQDYIWINFGNMFATRTQTTNNYAVSFSIPINANFGEKIIFNRFAGFTQQLSVSASGTSISQTSIQILTQDRRPLSLNGAQCSFLFSYTTAC